MLMYATAKLHTNTRQQKTRQQKLRRAHPNKVEWDYFETRLTSSGAICVVANTVGSSYSTFSVTNSS